MQFAVIVEARASAVGVMDSTAMAMCMDNDLPIMVLNLWEENALERAMRGETVGTVISV